MSEFQIRSDQLAALWEQTGLDESPYPITFDVSAFTPDEHARVQRQICDFFAGDAGESVRDAVRVLAEPEAFVEVAGVDVTGARIRAIGAQSYRYSAVATQFPGARDDIGGEVRLRFDVGANVGSLLASTIPRNRAGTRTFARNDPEPEFFSGSVLRDVYAPKPLPKFERAVRAGYAGAGTIEVFTGPRYRPSDVAWLRWFDLAGDGRYVITSRDENEAKAASVDQIAKWCQKAVTRGVTAFHEANDELQQRGWA